MRDASAAFAIIACLAVSPVRAQEPAASAGDAFPRGEVVEEVATLEDPTYSFALYLPSNYDPRQRWPLVYVLDPRGRAVMALELFREAAEHNGFIVVSSYQTRSDTNTSVTTQAVQALFNDIPRRLAFDPRRVLLAGMSGTAHAAWALGQALDERLAGVIACAGGVQNETYGPTEDRVPFAYYGITMTDDFNYQEMMRLEEHLDEVGSPHHFEVTPGRHGWPSREAAGRALDWMALQFTLAGAVPPYEGFLEERLAARREFARALEDPLARLRHERSLARDFAALDLGENGYGRHDSAVLESLMSSDEVTAARKLERRLEKRERSYLTNSLGGWRRQLLAAQNPADVAHSRVLLRLGSLHDQAEDSDTRRAASARRLLENVFTLASFYLPQTLEAQGKIDRAEVSLRVAADVFPDRPWTWWRLAELYLAAGWKTQSVEALRTLTELGALAANTLEQPRWQVLADEKGWERLVAAVEDQAASDIDHASEAEVAVE